jgi:threonine/homoserine/homoserine lactone efflux protein
LAASTTMTIPGAAASFAWVLSALAFALAMAGTPGPNNAMLAASGSLWGFRRTIPHMLGVAIGFPIMLLAVAAGAGDLLLHHRAVIAIMRWTGAVYLLYLAWRIALAQPSAPPDNPARQPANRRPLSFVQAALFQWINPKAWLVALSAAATLTTVARHPSPGRSILLAVVFLAVTLPITAFWTSVGLGAARLFTTRAALRRFNLVMASLLVASVVSVLAGVG